MVEYRIQNLGIKSFKCMFSFGKFLHKGKLSQNDFAGICFFIQPLYNMHFVENKL